MGMRKRGQNLVEYVVLVGAVIASLIAMLTYVRRGLSARLHDAAGIGEPGGAPPQYEPYYLSSSSKLTVQVKNIDDPSTPDPDGPYTVAGGEVTGAVSITQSSQCLNGRCPTQTIEPPPNS